MSQLEPSANPQSGTSRLTGLIIAIMAVTTLLAIVIVLAALSIIPDQRTMMTPVMVTGTPKFAAEVEARVAAADPKRGPEIFQRYECQSCHGQENLQGPYYKGLGARAATRRPNYSAAAYIYESITQPNAYTVPGHIAGLMPQNFKLTIPTKDLYDLIAWLLQQ